MILGNCPGTRSTPPCSQLWHSHCMTQQNKLCTVIFIYVCILNPKRGEWDAAADWESTGSCPVTQQAEVTARLLVESVPLRNSSPLPRPRECACDRVGCHWGPLWSFISYKHSVGRKEASVLIRPVGPGEPSRGDCEARPRGCDPGQGWMGAGLWMSPAGWSRHHCHPTPGFLAWFGLGVDPLFST